MGITEDSGAFRVPIDGELDLHTYAPGDLKTLLPEYLAECRAKGILEVRVVHGKGTGALKRSVYAILERLPEVLSFRDDHSSRGSWGATIVTLAPLREKDEGPPGAKREG